MTTLIQHPKFNRTILAFASLLGFVSHVAFAAQPFSCENYATVIQDPDPYKVPNSFLYILCPLQGAINIGLYFVGAVLIILILYGAIKAVTSVGNAKQLEGAKMTWSYAFFGFLIIVFSLTIIWIAFSLFGSNVNPFNVTGYIQNAFDALFGNLVK
jgi:hypothetical protein